MLKKHDWTESSPQAARTVHAGPDWTDVRDSTNTKAQRWREQQRRREQEEEQERQRRAEEIRRRNEELAKRSFWQGIMWGDNLENPGFLVCLFHLSSLIVGFVCSASLIYVTSNLIIGSVSRIILGKTEDGDWFLGGIIGLAIIGFTQSGLIWLWKSFRNRSRTT